MFPTTALVVDIATGKYWLLLQLATTWAYNQAELPNITDYAVLHSIDISPNYYQFSYVCLSILTIVLDSLGSWMFCLPLPF